MRHLLRNAPALVVLGLGVMLIAWVPCSLGTSLLPPGVAKNDEGFRLCPPSLTGLGSTADWQERAAAFVVGGAAVAFAWLNLRQQ
jgi:hypothetical protein